MVLIQLTVGCQLVIKRSLIIKEKIDGSVNWDGNTGWSGDPDDVKNSYIGNMCEGSDAEFAIRKYAKETNTPGLYDVYLNVRGNNQKDIKPVDIVLVVDMSGSMEPSE